MFWEVTVTLTFNIWPLILIRSSLSPSEGLYTWRDSPNAFLKNRVHENGVDERMERRTTRKHKSSGHRLLPVLSHKNEIYTFLKRIPLTRTGAAALPKPWCLSEVSCCITTPKPGVFNAFQAKDPKLMERWSRDALIYILYKIVFYIKLGLVSCINIATLLLCIQY